MAYLEGKGFLPSFHWQDVWAEEHAHAFTVAKATEMDILKAIRDDVERAVRDGIPFEQFRQDLTPRLVALGWWGKKPMVDPVTGEEKIVQLGSPRRLQTIYWANTRSAYAAGQWERAQRTKRALPYFIYELGPSENHRPHHVALAGTKLPVDHPFWDTHFCPNGWGCKCRLRQITQFECDELGGVSPDPEIVWKEFRNKRTGEITMIPEGVDPGWHTNPGKARAQTLMQGFESRLKDAPEPVARKAIADFWESRAPEAYRRMAEAVDLPVAVAPRLAADLDAASAIVAVSNHAIGDGELAPYGEVQRMIDEGAETKQPGGLRRFWHRLRGRSWTASIGRAANGLLRLVGLNEADETRPE
ncbi:phage head morphogenesis protein [Shinella sp. WSD5-1]